MLRYCVIMLLDASHPSIIPNSRISYLIQGNSSTEMDYIFDESISKLEGSDITVAAYYEKNGKMLVVNSTIFLDNYFNFNKPFIKNVVSWLGEEKRKKKKKGSSKSKGRKK